jgi:two-component system, chemotaxis family, protein-glutamate methylesterase/glutaminase
MHCRDIVVIGASAGGLVVLQQLMATLPRDFQASVFIVVHVSPDYPSMLAGILDYAGPLPVEDARDREPVLPGRVSVAPPDHHLVLEEGQMRLSRGPRENRFRPAVDVLFRSAARAYGPRVIGVILSGGLDDGVAGLYAIKQRGGRAVVQDPREALHSSMPRAALAAVAVDHVTRSERLAPLLVELCQERVDPSAVAPVSRQMELEVRTALEDSALEMRIMEVGELSPLTCPECHGALLRFMDGTRSRFRCHTGHAFSLDTLLVGLTTGIEEALWSAIRGIEESEILLVHMAEHYATAGEPAVAAQLRQKARVASSRAELVRQAVLQNEILSPDHLREDPSNGDNNPT